MRTITAILTIGLAMLTAHPALAQDLGGLPVSPTSSPSATPETGTLLKAESGTLRLGLQNLNDYRSCHMKNSCQDLEGIAIRDHDVAEVLALAPSGSNVRLYLFDSGDSSGSALSEWRVCMHTSSGFLLGCYENGSYGVSGKIKSGTVSLRVILDRGIDRPYELRIAY